jgi:hypothetical protein
MDLGSGIRDPGSGKTYSGFRIQGSKRHRILDPDPQHCSYGTSSTSSVLILIRIRIKIKNLVHTIKYGSG